jgi:glycerol uptake facilitator-like aquaporin
VNPARSLGPAIVSADYASIGIYLTAPFLGALVGWFVHRILSADEAADEAAG